MAPPPKFVQRIGRLPEVVNVLSAYPDGLPLSDLAAQFGVEVDVMRQDLATYLDLDSWGWRFDIFGRPDIEFVSPDRDTDDESDGWDTDDAGTVVRLLPDGTGGLGADYLSAGDLSVVYTAGVALLDVEPGNADLAEALAVIAETVYGEPASAPWGGGDRTRELLALLQEAQERRRKLVIVYSNAWRETVGERIVEPLRLVQTKRGWEVDAGPVGPEGNLRTYLLSNVRSAELLDDGFEPPPGETALLARQRRTTTVRMTIAQDARWAASQLAERVVVVAEDEEQATLDLAFLPPVGERVGLIMLASGPSTIVTGEPLTAAMLFVGQLLRHHSKKG
ncbi:MAG: WYL domain-containing protein [Sporichthyaceae bacterium]